MPGVLAHGSLLPCVIKPVPPYSRAPRGMKMTSMHSRRRRRAACTALIAAAVIVVGVQSATAVAPALRTVSSVSGTTGGITAMALSPDGARAYLVDGSLTLKIVDTATSAVIGASQSFSGFGRPVDVDVAPDRPDVYVATDAGWVLDVAADGSLAILPSFPVTQFGAVAAIPGSASVVVAPSTSAPTDLFRVNVFPPPAPGSISPIGFGTAPAPSTLGRLVVAPGNGNDNDVLVAGTSAGAGVLYIFDSPYELAGPAHTVTLPGSASAYSVAISPDGSRAIVTAPIDQKAYVIDVAAGTVLHTIDVSHYASAVAFTPDGQSAYVVGDNAVSTVDVASGTVTATLLIDTTSADAVVVSPSGKRVWVADAHTPGGIALLSASTVAAPATSGMAGSALTATFSASGFDIAPTFAVAPALPAGLSLNATTGVVSGTPAAALSSTTFVVTATSTDGNTATAQWTLQVAAALVASATPTPTPTVSATPTTALAESGDTAGAGLLLPIGALLAAGVTLVVVSRAGERRRATR